MNSFFTICVSNVCIIVILFLPRCASYFCFAVLLIFFLLWFLFLFCSDINFFLYCALYSCLTVLPIFALMSFFLFLPRYASYCFAVFLNFVLLCFVFLPLCASYILLISMQMTCILINRYNLVLAMISSQIWHLTHRPIEYTYKLVFQIIFVQFYRAHSFIVFNAFQW